jgi:peptidyl-prolyl cis-trans isomerase C
MKRAQPMDRITTVVALAVTVIILLATSSAFADDVALPARSGLAADVIVNGHPISNNHVTLMSTNFSPEKTLPGAEARNAARAELITEEVLAQAALKDGLDKKPQIADQLAYQQRAILSRAYLEDYFAKNPISEESLKSSYEWNRANGKIVEYKVRQILVQSSSQASELIARLDKGEDFADLAKRYTQDPGAQQTGGDLGWFRPDIFVDHHFADAVAALKKGEYSKQPVRTRFGWHVIKLEEGPRAVAHPEPYDALSDSVKQAIQQKTAQLKLEALTAKLSANAKLSGPGVVASNARSAK